MLEEGRPPDKYNSVQSNIRPQRSFMKPRTLVQPLPSCLASVPSLNSVLAPIASPEVVSCGLRQFLAKLNYILFLVQ